MTSHLVGSELTFDVINKLPVLSILDPVLCSSWYLKEGASPINPSHFRFSCSI